ncbi:phage portal protein [Paenibacillus graminis]|uniref:phage portal protein n=1 Tax=Paenibacillus graminis TaxID=189425 RepID=UPI002DBBB130|nr:phage portal protein [Paenibacillus graminis]MEC0171665.1 phage portal protein [Paenibacillus graminis]
MSTTEEVIRIIETGAASAMTDEQIIQQEIGEWLTSRERNDMLEGERYYRNRGDIIRRKRMTVGDGGALVEAKNLADNKLVHGFLRKLVDQKAGYLLGKEMSIQTKNEVYDKLLTGIFDKGFRRLLKSLLKESIKKGKAWLHVYYDEDGNFRFKKIPSEQIIPLWKDTAHTELDALIRVYEVEVYQGITKTFIKKVEFWNSSGVNRYELGTVGINSAISHLTADVELGETSGHFKFMDTKNNEKDMVWDRIPFICFKYNEDELPLIALLKSLIDDYDRNKSDNSNNLEDLPNSVYKIKGYDGTDLGEFRRQLMLYRAVKVTAEENADVETINLEIDTEAYKLHMEMTRSDIYEFGRGIDTQADSFATAPSGEALKFLYADLDMDANDIENEFQAALEQLLWFVNTHIANTTKQDFSKETVNFLFNRDIVINESQVITDAKNSTGVISQETIVANHPWVTDTKEELARIEAEEQANLKKIEDYGLPGGPESGNSKPEDDEE